MCGICGVARTGDRGLVSLDLLGRMAATIAHRGPDDEGFFTDRYVGFGFRRLSIIDLSLGHQPMSDAEENVWIVFNGEIYNYPELRKELEGHGHAFRTNSDTEVILHGYKQWGKGVLTRLNGMFGFAIWDKRTEQLLIARDRMGIKLIYYAQDNGTLIFGSEIRPILAALPSPPEMDPVALNLFLRYRYTPSPLTVFKGIRKLAPGTCLIVRNGRIEVERYDTFAPEPFSPMPSMEDAEEQLLALYRQAVKRQLMSDVPLGLLLSGGLDSGLLLGLMKECGASWNTYTVGFGTSFKDDELDDAAETARVLGSPNYAVRLDRETFEASLSKIVAYLEEPVASPSIVPMYHVCQRARQDVKVALCGQGPDELFAGYRRHLGVRYGAYWRSLPEWVRTPARGALGMLPRNDAIRRALYSLDVPDRLQRYQQVFSIMRGDVIDGLFQKDALPAGAGDEILDCWADYAPLMRHTDELGGFNFLEVRSSLPDELLMYADKLSMAHSLETRVPYLDQDVVEYAERLDASFKIRGLSRKYLHRRVCRKYLPEAIVNRKKKGFAVNVVDDWFRGSISGKLEETLLDPQSRMYAYMEPGAIRGLVRQHLDGQKDNHKILFSLVMLEEWMRNFASKPQAVQV
ncbi:MAG: asparagine synthase (glutamine-hydrolyzing) [Candidatus Hydrogenedentes bacterium]|nr:asparagine synthase (glutamine-hydrolyzing) [Candidatus Hydrogenedentota bacterium]